MGGIRFFGCGCQSENPLSVLARNPKGQRARSPTRPEEDEGRKIPGTVGRKGQSRDESRTERRPVNRS